MNIYFLASRRLSVRRSALHAWCAISLLLALCGCGDTKIERTTGRQALAIAAALDTHLVTRVAAENRVRFVSDGTLGISDPHTGWQKEFTLASGESFVGQADHHASATYKLLDIGPTMLKISYSVTFDASSFGKRTVSIDEGEVELAYKPNR